MSSGAVLALMTDAFGGRGGIAQYNRDLAAALASAPAVGRVEILPRLTRDALGPLPTGVRQHPARFGRLLYALEALRLATRCRPRLVFCGHLFMAPLAALLAWRFKARLVVQAHGVEVWRRPTAAQRAALERADLVLTVSRDTRARVLTWARLDPSRVRVANNTVAEDFTPGATQPARARFGLTDEFVLLTVGRLDSRERYKGHDLVIQALRRLADDDLRPLYLIAGEGDDRRRLERLARRHGVAGQVRFLGHTPRADLPDLYRAAQLFVLPSAGEGFGIVLLEAMASGAAAAALAVGGTRDALADGRLGRFLDTRRLEADLQGACRDLIAGRLPSGEALSAEVRARFGRAAFERRIALALGELEPAAAPSMAAHAMAGA